MDKKDYYYDVTLVLESEIEASLRGEVLGEVGDVMSKKRRWKKSHKRLLMPDNRVSGEKAENFEMEEHSMKKRVCLLVTLLAIVIMGFTVSVEAAEIIDQGYYGGEGDGKNLML